MKTLVDVARFAPGCCLVCRTSKGPFVDLGVDANALDRAYLCATCVGECAAEVGGCTPQARGALEEQLAAAEVRVAELEQELSEVDEDLERAERLRAAVAFTLEHGVVVDKRGKGAVKLRPVPGTRAVDVDEPIVPPADDAGEGEAEVLAA